MHAPTPPPRGGRKSAISSPRISLLPHRDMMPKRQLPPPHLRASQLLHPSLLPSSQAPTSLFPARTAADAAEGVKGHGARREGALHAAARAGRGGQVEHFPFLVVVAGFGGAGGAEREEREDAVEEEERARGEGG